MMLCETSLHVPRKLPPATPSGIAPHWRPVEMTARDGAVLKAWLLSPATVNGDFVITLHGIADSRTGTAGLARLFVENHYTVLMPDSRAHGESGGAIATYGLLEAGDVHQWVDWLIASEHPRSIFAMGESLGAAVLLQSLAVEPRFRAVVAESPFANLKDITEYRVARMLPIPPWLGYAAAKPMVWSGFLYARRKYGVDFRGASPEDQIGSGSTPVGSACSSPPDPHAACEAAGPSRSDRTSAANTDRALGSKRDVRSSTGIPTPSIAAD